MAAVHAATVPSERLTALPEHNRVERGDPPGGAPTDVHE